MPLRVQREVLKNELDFLRLPHDYSERDLEDAILREMERFLLELGVGFTFVARQKRISVGADDFYLDLLFYHRHLKKFQPAHWFDSVCHQGCRSGGAGA